MISLCSILVLDICKHKFLDLLKISRNSSYAKFDIFN